MAEVADQIEPRAQELDRVIWRQDLQDMLRVTSETMRRWINAGKLPEPDVAISRRTMAWRLSTLRAAGIKLPG